MRINPDGTVDVLWHAAGAANGSPIVGGGRVWTIDAAGGRLLALDPRTGRTSSSCPVGVTSRFATPAVDGPDLLVPTMDGLAIVRG